MKTQIFVPANTNICPKCFWKKSAKLYVYFHKQLVYQFKNTWIKYLLSKIISTDDKKFILISQVISKILNYFFSSIISSKSVSLHIVLYFLNLFTFIIKFDC